MDLRNPERRGKDLIWIFPKKHPPKRWSRLRELRIKNNLRMVDIANGAKIGFNTLFLYENGTLGTNKMKEKISDYFGLEVEEIFPVYIQGDVIEESGEKVKIELR